MKNAVGPYNMILALRGNTEHMINKLKPVVQEAIDHLEYLETLALECEESLEALNALEIKKEQDTK